MVLDDTKIQTSVKTHAKIFLGLQIGKSRLMSWHSIITIIRQILPTILGRITYKV
jgi:4-diphosphocytidyl-2C-methyl-D-erythritol kinase